MKIFVRIRFVLLVFSFSFSFCGPASAWSQYRGFNVNAAIVTEADFRDMRDFNVNVARLNFNKMPLIKGRAPFDVNEEAVARLDRIVGWANAYRIGVIIDPHTPPGTLRDDTMQPNDAFWKSQEMQDAYLAMWSFLAERYSKTDAVAGYDLLNEPAVPTDLSGKGWKSWNSLAGRLIAAIREKDEHHPIILEPAVGRGRDLRWVNRFDGVSYINLVNYKNIVVSPHFYDPQPFSHQGVLKKFSKSIQYPGFIDGEQWDANKVDSILAPVDRFQKATNVPIFIGEFSASRYAGAASERYLKDLIDAFEKRNWGWAYHVFRAAPVWDPELPDTRDSVSKRSSDSPRMKLLKSYFVKNNKTE
ncbi:glycoside hydrolase family 5 protein [Solimonas variicoloris]|uniref:glycoside hydrolase family 5 protein n=1 Tax=Solimonas variicoloris TaxID=254408 RepID=UPI000A067B45|nr:cellulase family glycosylhydrolase [Solimonas variicoloris]